MPSSVQDITMDVTQVAVSHATKDAVYIQLREHVRNESWPEVFDNISSGWDLETLFKNEIGVHWSTNNYLLF